MQTQEAVAENLQLKKDKTKDLRPVLSCVNITQSIEKKKILKR